MKITSLEHLRACLLEHNIPIQDWGSGMAKSARELYEEIELQDCTLDVCDGILTRKILGVEINIHAFVVVDWDGPLRHFRLREWKQVLPSGRERDRSQMRASVTEKRHPWETNEQVARRGLKEELLWDNPDTYHLSFSEREVNKEPDFSKSYPGLRTVIRELTTFRCLIMPALFQPAGYVIKEEDGKTTHFVWEEQPEPPTPYEKVILARLGVAPRLLT